MASAREIAALLRLDYIEDTNPAPPRAPSAMFQFPHAFRRPGPLGVACLAGLLAASVLPTTLAAQRERVTVRMESFGGTPVTVPAGTTAREEFTQQALQITLSQRLVRQQGNTIVLVGGQWRAVRAALPRAPLTNRPGAVGDAFTSLQVATAELMLLRSVGDRHTLVSLLRPGLYGDAFRVEGAAFVDRIVSPRTTIGAGLSYASSFGRLLPIPVVHVLSRPSRRLLVDALLPARGDLWWMPRKGLDVGLNASLVGAQYGLSETQRIAGSDALWLANATVGPQLRWAPRGGKWQLTGDAGMTVLRRLEYVRDGRRVADLAPGNVPYVRLGAQRLF
ncbi:hypothetical protein [Gemmatimonas phototrophica]|nr:hypothetical protein [Gemmatimonas phototrophica]